MCSYVQLFACVLAHMLDFALRMPLFQPLCNADPHRICHSDLITLA